MKRFVLVGLLACAAALFGQESAPSKPLPPPLLKLMAAIHRDLLKHRNVSPWLRQYSDKAMLEPGTILYMAPETGDPNKPQPQAPDQLLLTFMPIQKTKGFKYFTIFDHEPACRFEKYGMKLYGFVVDWGPDRDKVERLVKRIAVEECRKFRS